MVFFFFHFFFSFYFNFKNLNYMLPNMNSLISLLESQPKSSLYYFSSQ